MKKHFFYSLCITVGIFSLTQCTHEPALDLTPSIASTCDADTVYFTNTVLPLILANCTQSGCHDAETAEDGVDLTDYANIMNTGEVSPFNPNNSELYESIIETDPDDIMPPPSYSPLTSEQIGWVRTWIEQGALNNGCEEACDVNNLTASFSADVKPIIDAKCGGCHSTIESGGGILLTNYDNISAKALDGSLYGSIIHDAAYVAMPIGGQLPQCEIDVIQLWIANGSQND
ncbi:MAG: c-type cytochrome domain-containing protein [Chitinophagales bacterium]